MKTFLTRLPTHRASEIGQLLRISGCPPESHKVTSADVSSAPNPFVDKVRVKAMAQLDAGNRGAGLGVLLNDLDWTLKDLE